MDRGELDLQFSVSATNRHPREGEVDGVNYHFLTDQQFRDLIAEGAFVEYEQVYPGRYYGTLRSEIQNRVDAGHNVILDIDVKGGVNVKKQFGDDAMSIFIAPPSLEELRRRLEGRGRECPAELAERVGRGSECPAEIAERVGRADFEMQYRGDYDHVVVNDSLPQAIAEVETLMKNFIEG